MFNFSLVKIFGSGKNKISFLIPRTRSGSALKERPVVVELRGAFESEGVMGALTVELAEKSIEAGLLLKTVHGYPLVAGAAYRSCISCRMNFEILSKDGTYKRSPGECTFSSVGPTEIMSMLGTFNAI